MPVRGRENLDSAGIRGYEQALALAQISHGPERHLYKDVRNLEADLLHALIGQALRLVTGIGVDGAIEVESVGVIGAHGVDPSLMNSMDLW
ncbi:hypothetical protein D3C76_1551620 [compost metagenome]